MRRDGEAGKSLQWSDLSGERPERERRAGRSLGLAAFAAQIAPLERFDGYAVAAYPLTYPIAGAMGPFPLPQAGEEVLIAAGS